MMRVPTQDRLFEHNCQLKDMKLSGFNPRHLFYYCRECGGKLVINRTQEWEKLFREKPSLKLSKKLLELAEL